MQFIASLWEGWGEVKQVVENQPETTPLAANPAAELVTLLCFFNFFL